VGGVGLRVSLKMPIAHVGCDVDSRAFTAICLLVITFRVEFLLPCVAYLK